MSSVRHFHCTIHNFLTIPPPPLPIAFFPLGHIGLVQHVHTKPNHHHVDNLSLSVIRGNCDPCDLVQEGEAVLGEVKSMLLDVEEKDQSRKANNRSPYKV